MATQQSNYTEREREIEIERERERESGREREGEGGRETCQQGSTVGNGGGRRWGER
jgi:hypothetical protein